MKTVMAVVCALSASLASAHNLWIEPTSSDMQALYGEPEIRLSERSPGKLDGLVITRSERTRMLEPNTPETVPVTWRKEGAGFRLQGANGDAGALVEARSTVIRSDAFNHGATQAVYYARYAAWPLMATAPAMKLDIVPTSEPYTFAVHFNGAPLKRGTLKVIAPSLWLQVHDIDEQGLVRIHAPWRGQYVLDVDTREQLSGEIAGQRYDSMVHRATLSFSTPEGAVFENPRPAQYRTNYQ